ncbi:peptide methionine sulfoxide reductase [Paenibacillus pectinilyticus]|uniref:Peptide methionine sulfoxide reductase MsrA n=1 Tax=Paenibacillus pectinilyticus TaxID=512399 RepID=A0A1C1A7T8_9BACL|nr:peptide-methionine (S)-S-oxide reductase [Paenibacillus pectinilyticus]OCT16599.1 peptide methionine sulfoxide reductase [Paenibacillus pectinilyticus]
MVNNHDNIKTITLGMGCFWSPDALFGQMPGVVRTRVGYAGGTTSGPTYRNLGDHTETVELDFDPKRVSLESILELFWEHHHPPNINEYKGRQYLSLVLYRDELQKNTIYSVTEGFRLKGKGRPDTEIALLKGFYPAEERHQKYYLKRYPDAVLKLRPLYPTPEGLMNATLAARLNGLAKGFTNLSLVIQDIQSWPIAEVERGELIRLVQGIKW